MKWPIMLCYAISVIIGALMSESRYSAAQHVKVFPGVHDEFFDEKKSEAS